MTTENTAKRLPTPYPELNAVLGELVQGFQEALGDTFIGAYLQGSFAHGGFDEHSDVDFMIVIAQELTGFQVSALQNLHDKIFSLASPWAQHLEGSYFPKDVLRRRPQAGRKLWYLDNGSRSLILSDHCNTLVVRWVVRQHGITLAGPEPASLIDPISPEALRQEIYAVIQDWGAQILTDPGHYNNRFYQSFIVLSYCRMLHSLHTGTIESKRAGAEWAKVNLDPAWIGLIDRTWAGRPKPEISVRQPADPADFAQTLEFIRCIIRESDQAAPGLEIEPVSQAVVLRAVLESDLPIFFEQQLDPQAAAMAGFPSRNRDDFMAHWTKIMVDDANLLRTILFNGQVAGNIVNFWQSGHREVGYWIGSEFWGQGIASRALAEFLKLERIRPLYAFVAKHNLASRRVLEKNGFAIHREDSDGFTLVIET